MDCAGGLSFKKYGIFKKKLTIGNDDQIRIHTEVFTEYSKLVLPGYKSCLYDPHCNQFFDICDICHFDFQSNQFHIRP